MKIVGEAGEITDLGQALNQQYTEQSSWNSQNNNVKAVSWLTNESNWTLYKTDYTKWAIGAPTIEMWVKSYNSAKVGTELAHSAHVEIKVPSSTALGYLFGKTPSSGDTSFRLYLGSLLETTDIDKAIYGKAESYWLSSPADKTGGNNVCLVNTNGYDLYTYSYNLSRAIRPVVSIPLTKFQDGTLTITNKYFND